MYAAELKAMHLGLKTLKANDEYFRSHMYMDNQAAIKVIANSDSLARPLSEKSLTASRLPKRFPALSKVIMDNQS